MQLKEDECAKINKEETSSKILRKQKNDYFYWRYTGSAQKGEEFVDNSVLLWWMRHVKQ